jgi:hypothetical protein
MTYARRDSANKPTFDRRREPTFKLDPVEVRCRPVSEVAVRLEDATPNSSRATTHE